MPARKLDFYLNSSDSLRDLTRAAQNLSELQQILTKNAPPELTNYCLVKQLRAGILTLGAENAAIATQLKQLTPRLLTCYKKQRSEVTSIRIEVQVTNPLRNATPKHEKSALSLETIENIQGLADQLDASPLKDALNRLAARNRAGR